MWRGYRRAVTAAAVVALASGGLATGVARADTVGPTVSIDNVAQALFDSAHDRYFLSDGSKVVVLAADGSTTATVPVDGAAGLALAPDGSTLYVAQPTHDAITEVDTATITAVGTLPTGSGTCPRWLAGQGSALWVGYGCSTGDVARLDPASPATLPLPLRYPVPPGSANAAPYVAVSGARLLALAPTTYDSYGEPQTRRELFDVSQTVPVPLTHQTGPAVRDPQITPDGTTALLAGLTSELVSMTDLSVLHTYTSGDVYDAQLSPDGRHIAMTELEQNNEPQVVVYATGSDTARHAMNLPPRPDGAARDYPMWAMVALFLGDSTHLLSIADYRLPDASYTRYVVSLDGWPDDPAELTATTSTAASQVTVSGSLAFTDGDAAVGGQLVTVSRSGPDGTHVVATRPTDSSGGYSVIDAPPGPGGYTYRAAWAGDDGHGPALAQDSVTIGALESPGEPLPDVLGADTGVALGLTKFADAVVDDLHRHVLVVGDQQLQVRDFEGHLVTTLDLGHSADIVTLSPDYTTAFVTEAATGTTTVIDTATSSVVGSMGLGPLVGYVTDVAAVGDQLYYGSSDMTEDLNYLSLSDPLEVTKPAYGLLEPDFSTSHDQPSTFVTYDAAGDPASVTRWNVAGDTPTPTGGGWNPQVATTADDTAVGGPVSLSDDGQHILTIDPSRVVDIDASGLTAGTRSSSGSTVFAGTAYETGDHTQGAYLHDGRYLAVGHMLNPGEQMQVRPTGTATVQRTFTVPSVQNSSTPYPTRDESRLFWVTSDIYGTNSTLQVGHEPTWPFPCLTVPVPPDTSAGQPIAVSGVVRGSTGDGVPATPVHVNVTAPDGSTTTADAATDSSGTFDVSLPTGTTGGYHLTLTAALPTGITCTAAVVAQVDAPPSPSATPDPTPSQSATGTPTPTPTDASPTPSLSATPTAASPTPTPTGWPTTSTTPSPTPTDSPSASPSTATSSLLHLVVHAGVISIGQSDALRGRLTSGADGSGLAGRYVRLVARPAGSTSRWTTVAGSTTDDIGAVRFRVTPAHNRTYELRFGGDDSGSAARSNDATVKVRSVASLRVVSGGESGGTLTLAGWVRPAHPRGLVLLQRRVGTHWSTIRRLRLSARSRYRVAMRVLARTRTRYRLLVPADARNVAGASSALSVDARVG